MKVVLSRKSKNTTSRPQF